MTDMKKILKKAKTIAIVGLSNKPERTSYRIGKYLQNTGKYKIIPVNPTISEVFGEKSYASLKDIPEDIEIDIVNIFRRSEYLEDIARDVVELGCGAFWAQLGVYNENAEKTLKDAEIPTIMNTCIFVEHQNLIY